MFSTRLYRITDPTKCALIIIDAQNDMYNDDGWFAKMGVDISHIKRTIPNIKKLIATARKLKIPIIYTRHLFRDERDGGLIVKFRPYLKEGGYRRGTWGGEIFEEFKPEEDDWIVDKSRYSAFYNTNLEVILRGLGVDTLIVTGQCTNMCVESTIRDACYRDYKAIAVSDACGTHTHLDLHDSSLKAIRWGFGDVATTDEIIKELESTKKG